MKKILLGIALAQLVHVSVQAAAITLNLAAGVLSLPNGNPIPNGSLIQLLVSTSDATFSAPTGLSFVGTSTDDVVVASFAMDSSTTGTPGGFAKPIILDYAASFSGKTIASGMPLLLRWWPNLTTASTDPSSDLQRVMGQYRTDSVTDFSDIAWVLPGAPSTKGLNALTSALGGSTPATSLRATAVPEPATASLLVLGSALTMMRRRKK